MKLINMIVDRKPRLGILTEKGVVDASTVRPGSEIPCTMMEAIRMGRENALPLLQMAENLATHYLDESTITYAPAVDAPSKILCAGVNYRAHIEETRGSFEPAGVPTIFAKFNNTLAPHRGKVIRCRSSKKHDYEAEIAVIIGKRASYITLDRADEHIFGYTLANDISARDLQKATSQWVPGKTCDTFCPLGPCIVTADALDFDKMHITGYKNGELRQEGRHPHRHALRRHPRQTRGSAGLAPAGRRAHRQGRHHRGADRHDPGFVSGTADMCLTSASSARLMQNACSSTENVLY